MFPPQIMLLSLFQILVQYRLFNSLTGLTWSMSSPSCR